MINLGLTAQKERLFVLGLTKPHLIQFRVNILDLNHGHVEDVSDRFLDGQVNVDNSRDVPTDLSCTLVDRGLLAFESGNLSTGTNFRSRMIQVDYGVFSESLPEWVWVPVFCGPITTFSRDDAMVNITAVGKEALLKTKSWVNRTYPKGIKKVDLIRDILAKNGEYRVDIPNWSVRTDRVMTIPAEREVLEYVQSLSHSWGSGRLMFDGRGRGRLFGYSSASRFTFRTGEGGSIKSVPKVSYTLGEEFTNAARVYGPTPTGKGAKPIFAEYVAAPNHSLSPYSLARDKKPQFFAQTLRDAQVTTQQEAYNLAKSIVEGGLLGAVSVEIETLPIPHLEPWDVVTLVTDDYSETFSLGKYSLPLNSSGSMTIGYNAKVSRWRK